MSLTVGHVANSGIDEAEYKHPKTHLRFLDTVVSTRERDHNVVTGGSCSDHISFSAKECNLRPAENSTDQSGEVEQARRGVGKVVGFGANVVSFDVAQPATNLRMTESVLNETMPAVQPNAKMKPA